MASRKTTLDTWDGGWYIFSPDFRQRFVLPAVGNIGILSVESEPAGKVQVLGGVLHQASIASLEWTMDGLSFLSADTVNNIALPRNIYNC